jgi:hypothetical protein
MYPIYSRYLLNIYNIYNIRYLYDIYTTYIIIYRVPNKSTVYDRYLTTRYMCVICTICIVYVTDFPHLYYTYRVTDICIFIEYHTHFMQISCTYQVPDMYPIYHFLTSVSTSCTNRTIELSRILSC